MVATILMDVSERLNSRILRDNRVRREEFDPNNLEHLESYYKFLTTGNWGEVQFYCEFPYVTVPETVLRKFAITQLETLLGLTAEHSEQ